MKVSLLLAADYANVTQDGKLNVMGIFDNIRALSFPARHASMSLVAKLAAEFGEGNDTRDVTIKLIDQDGGELLSIPQTIQVPAISRGKRPEFNFIMGLQDLVFPTPGIYTFTVHVDKDLKAELPIEVMQAEQT